MEGHSVTGRYPELAGKRVLVTGGASGIGWATATRFLHEGAEVMVWDRDEAALARVSLHAPSLRTDAVDIGEAEGVATAYARLDQVWPTLDVLVANAGISIRHRFLETTSEEWREVMRVNLDGAFYCAQGALKRMAAHGSGTVLFTASTNGMRGHPLYADYNASKAGVMLLAQTLALEFAPHIRVNAVAPGYVLTPMQQQEYTPEMIEEVNQGIPLKRHAAPEEVAALFCFLASDDARYITGQCVPIDGGETA